MLRIIFDISFFAQGLILLIMAHLPTNGELGMVVLYADGVRVPLTFLTEENGLDYVTSQRLSVRIGFKRTCV